MLERLSKEDYKRFIDMETFQSAIEFPDHSIAQVELQIECTNEILHRLFGESIPEHELVKDYEWNDFVKAFPPKTNDPALVLALSVVSEGLDKMMLRNLKAGTFTKDAVLKEMEQIHDCKLVKSAHKAMGFQELLMVQLVPQILMRYAHDAKEEAIKRFMELYGHKDVYDAKGAQICEDCDKKESCDKKC